MVRYCYIVAEGPQDIEFLISLLRLNGLQKVVSLRKLSSSPEVFWKPLIPEKFPVGDDLLKRHPVPYFLKNDQLSIALMSANGITRVAPTIEENFKALAKVNDPSEIFGIGIFLDADTTETPQKRFEDLINHLSSLELPLRLPLPTSIGEVSDDRPRLGIFIAPNNRESGTLEDILLDCARVNYPDLLDRSYQYIESIEREQLTFKDLEEFDKAAGRRKALVSSITSILKPGKSLQVSLQDNRWIDDRSNWRAYNSLKPSSIELQALSKSRELF